MKAANISYQTTNIEYMQHGLTYLCLKLLFSTKYQYCKSYRAISTVVLESINTMLLSNCFFLQYICN